MPEHRCVTGSKPMLFLVGQPNKASMKDLFCPLPFMSLAVTSATQSLCWWPRSPGRVCPHSGQLPWAPGYGQGSALIVLLLWCPCPLPGLPPRIASSWGLSLDYALPFRTQSSAHLCFAAGNVAMFGFLWMCEICPEISNLSKRISTK